MPPIRRRHDMRRFLAGRAESARSGLIYMVLSCVFFAIMGGLVNAVQLRETEASVTVSSFVRLLVNFIVLVGTAQSHGQVRNLFGDARGSLWLRGFFGSFSLIFSFAAIKAIGIGESSFLTASSGVFVGLLSPLLLGQRNSLRAWLAILGAMVGLFFLVQPRLDDAHPYGRAFALISGGCAALAYLMISRAGKSNSSSTVIFYFCLVGTLVHLLAFAVLPTVWPSQPTSYGLLILGGIAASVAQLFMTRSYQLAPAALNAAVSYLSPVLSMLISVVLFADRPDAKGWFGAAMILVCGVGLPFLDLAKKNR